MSHSALSHLHELAGAVNRVSGDVERGRLQSALAAGGRLLGILSMTPAAWFQRPITASLNVTLEPFALSATAVVGDITEPVSLKIARLR